MSAAEINKSRLHKTRRALLGLVVFFAVVGSGIYRSEGHSSVALHPANSRAKSAGAEVKSWRGTTAEEDSRKTSSLQMQLEDNPHDIAVYEELRELLESRHHERALLETVETWIAHNAPEWETMMQLNTTALIGLDDPEEAIREERLYLRQNPRRSDYGDTWDSVEGWLADNLLSRGYSQEALLHFQHQAAVMKRASEWCVLGNAQFGLGMTQQAMISYRKALEFERDYESAHSGLSKAYAKLRDFRHAETEAQAAISLSEMQVEDESKNPGHLFSEGHNPILSERHRALAMLYVTAGDRKRALEQETLAEKSDVDDFKAGMIEAMLYDQMGETARSRAIVESLHNKMLELISQEDKDSKEFIDGVSRIENTMAFAEPAERDSDEDVRTSAIWYLEPQFKAGTLKPMEQWILGEEYCRAGRIDDCEKLEMTAMETFLESIKQKQNIRLDALSQRGEGHREQESFFGLPTSRCLKI